MYFSTYYFLLLGLSNITKMAFINVRKNLMKILIKVIFFSFLKNKLLKLKTPIRKCMYRKHILFMEGKIIITNQLYILYVQFFNINSYHK